VVPVLLLIKEKYVLKKNEFIKARKKIEQIFHEMLGIQEKLEDAYFSLVDSPLSVADEKALKSELKEVTVFIKSQN